MTEKWQNNIRDLRRRRPQAILDRRPGKLGAKRP
jgi:hypothetical protein